MNFIISKLLRWADIYRENRRWKNNVQRQIPALYYGQNYIPDSSRLLSGGLVKLQDLIKTFPNQARCPNSLYIISSALPPNLDILLATAKKTKSPIILNQNGVAYPAWHGDGWELTNQRLKLAYDAADYIIFQSKFCKKSAEKFLGPSKKPHSILHNPVNTDQFSSLKGKRVNQNSIQLLVAGSHHFFYRIQSAIEALYHLSLTETKTYHLTIAGKYQWQKTEQQCIDDIVSLIEKYQLIKQISIPGPYTQDEAVNIFQASDILVHPTYNDACPRLVIEAMACGVPVVYSATGGTPELIPENAGVGIPGPVDWERIHPPSPLEIAKGITTITSKLNSYSINARQHAVTNHNVERWVNEHKNIFSSLLYPTHDQTDSSTKR